MAGQTQAQTPNENKVFSSNLEIKIVNNKTVMISDGSDYYALLYLSEEINTTDVDEIISKAEKIKIYRREHGRSVELLEFSYNEFSYNGKVTIKVDFGDDTPVLGLLLRDVLEGMKSIREYYREIKDYVADYIKIALKNELG